MKPSFSLAHSFKEISLFFAGRDQVHKTMRRVSKRLDRVGIAYAVIGGMAVHAHGHHQTTADVDLLMTEEGFAKFRQRFVPKNYEQVPNRTYRFVDKMNQIGVDIRVTGKYPGNGQPKLVSFPDPSLVSETIQEIKVVNLKTLIEMKLAARRFQDFADVISLIRVKNLNESFQEKLDPYVHPAFLKCLEEKRHEDENQERQDQIE